MLAPADLGRALATGRRLRVARFGNANEHADFVETAHHVFTYANALCQMLGRIGIATIDHLAAARAVLHGAMALYLTRYLNVPPARIPGGEDDRLDDLPADEGALRAALFSTPSDRQRQVDLTGQAGGPPLQAWPFAAGADRHARACGLLREDAGFHAYQDAGGEGPAIRRVGRPR